MNFLSTLLHRDTAHAPSHVGITLTDASYHYADGTVGLAPTSCTFAPGEGNVAIIGLNGAGKSTLVRLLGAAAIPTGGSITFDLDGTDCEPAHRAGRRRIEAAVGFVDLAHVESHFRRASSVEAALLEYLKRHGVSLDERIARVGALLERFDLLEVRHVPYEELDGERLHLLTGAVASATSPALLVADEPTRGLDEISSAHVARRLLSCGTPVIFSTHDVGLITHEPYGITRTIVMDETHLVFDGEPQRAASFYTQLIRSKYQSLTSSARATAPSTSRTFDANRSGSASSESAR